MSTELVQILREKAAEYERAIADTREEVERLHAELTELARRHAQASKRLEALERGLQASREVIALETGEEPEETDAPGGRSRETPFTSMSIAEVAAAILREAGGSLSTDDLFRRARAGGWESDAADPENSFRTALYREEKKPDGLIEKIGRGKFRLRSEKRRDLLAQLRMQAAEESDS